MEADASTLSTGMIAHQEFDDARANIGNQKTIALASGRSKIEAIRAVLASGLLHGIIIDERLTRSLTA